MLLIDGQYAGGVDRAVGLAVFVAHVGGLYVVHAVDQIALVDVAVAVADGAHARFLKQRMQELAHRVHGVDHARRIGGVGSGLAEEGLRVVAAVHHVPVHDDPLERRMAALEIADEPVGLTAAALDVAAQYVAGRFPCFPGIAAHDHQRGDVHIGVIERIIALAVEAVFLLGIVGTGCTAHSRLPSMRRSSFS